MTHVPHEAIGRSVVDVMQCDGEFDHAEVGCEMSARVSHGIDQKTAQLVGELGQLGLGERAQVFRVVNGVQQGIVHTGGHYSLDQKVNSALSGLEWVLASSARASGRSPASCVWRSAAWGRAAGAGIVHRSLLSSVLWVLGRLVVVARVAVASLLFSLGPRAATSH